MIGITSNGAFDATEAFLNKMERGEAFRFLDEYGQRGLDALALATPVNTGLTASSWSYIIRHNNGKYSIEWHNTNENDGVLVAILIQYGHGTGTGGYVSGIDYINPAIRPVFDHMAADIWERVRNA